MLVDFGVLGPLQVRFGQRRVDIGGQRQRRILAVLLLNAGATVSMADLVAAVWHDDPPATARRQVQSAVWQLRQVFARHGAADTLRSDPAGYRLDTDPQRVDLCRFETMLAEGRRLAAAGEKTRAAHELRAAVSLWRGPAMAGLGGTVLEREAARLDELRLTAIEDCVEAELACAEPPELVAELAHLSAAHPLRERLTAALMLALYRAGRQAEALETYHRIAAALAEELGIDPGPQLRHRQGAILRCDPALDGPTPQLGGPAPDPRPAQLPATTALFVGRAEHLRHLDALLPAPDRPGPAAVVITAVDGTAGIGKTALALHWAHRVADQFPDGQLYVNLRGFDPTGSPMPAAEAVRGFLDAFAIPRQRIPASLDAQAALYRSLLAGKQILVVLDNAYDAEQVRPLLPGSPTAVTVVTSRNRLTSLVAAEGAHPITLDLLTTTQARELLTRRLGHNRVAAEPEAVDEIITRCARLPLALTILAARAATHPQFPLATLAGELRDTRVRLDVFDDGDPATDVRTVFSWSYQRLSTQAARLFRHLGLHPGPDLATPAAASLAGLPNAQVRPLLAELTRAHLLTEHTRGRYAFHDLLVDRR